MSDKRYNGRKRKRLALSFGIGEATGRRAFTEDISPLGLFIKTPNVCNPNTLLKIELSVDTEPICFDARVMWAKRVPPNLFHLAKKGGMGVRIVRFNSGQEQYLTLCSDLQLLQSEQVLQAITT